jgi:hypothetical protein
LIQQKEAAQEKGEAVATSKQTTSVAEHVQKEEKYPSAGEGGEEASGPEIKIRKHVYTHHLR